MKQPKSKKPKKQRKFQRSAKLHERRKILSAHLSPALRKQYNRRSAKLRKGDEIEVMRGKFKKKTGTIARVSLKKYRVYADGIMIKRTDGTERQVGLHPSNLKITKLNLSDKKRVSALSKGKGVKARAPAKKVEKKTEKKVEKKEQKK